MNIDSRQNSAMDRDALLRSRFWTRIMKRISAFRPKLFLILLGTVFVSANTAVNATTSFTLSGSPDGTATILVDDDLDIYLDGAQIYTDGTNSAGNRPPIHFSADGGSSVRIVVRDTYGDCSSLSPVYLTSAGVQAIIADPGFNLGCGRPATDQGIVHDATFIVPDLSSQFQAWGNNYYGQFGNGQLGASYPGQLLPLPIYLPPNVSDIETVAISTGFLTADGTVFVSGDNDYGQLGQGYSSDPYPAPLVRYPTPLKVPGLVTVEQISGGGGGGSEFFVALLTDGTVRSWGSNGAGQLGNGVITPYTIPCKCVPTVQTVVGLSGVTSVSAGGSHVLALKADGTVWAWGGNYEGELGNGTFSDGVAVPAQVPGLPPIIAIAAGEAHSLALASDGTVWAWGDGGDGQIGNGLRNPIGINGFPNPFHVPNLSGVAAITAGSQHSMALKADGTVWAWGGNYLGQTGTGQTFTVNPNIADIVFTPTQAQISSVVSIKAKVSSVIARKTDGTVWTWGDGTAGEMGNGTSNQVNQFPLQVPIPPSVGGLIDIGSQTVFAYAPTNTATGDNVVVRSTAGDASVSFSQVTANGFTTFTAIDPNTAGTPPTGYTLCPGCPAYDISTTATYTPPVTVCINVPAAIDAATFNSLALLHGENGVLVDVTTSHVTNQDGTREVCGQVDSLSPFVLAQYTAPTPTPTPTPSPTPTPTPAVPAAPSNLMVTAVLSGEIDLAWVDNSNNESNFELERCDGKGKCRIFVLIASPGEDVISYADVGLLPGTQYTYRVRAVNLVGDSAYSNTVKAKTPRR